MKYTRRKEIIMTIQSFHPIVNEKTKILILGTMPSVKSLEGGMYYGNPRNHFWEMMSRLLLLDMSVDYSTRIEMLLESGIGLWDVYKSCERKGSLDQHIKEEIPNDIIALIHKYPDISCVVLNGSKALKGFKKHFDTSIRVIALPSTSPIPTKYCKTVEDKWEYWKVLRLEVL
jgi:TDG/mug DNA glycosylase family protein